MCVYIRLEPDPGLTFSEPPGFSPVFMTIFVIAFLFLQKGPCAGFYGGGRGQA